MAPLKRFPISSKASPRFKPHTTVRGRVVYDRPPHHFTARDLLRIARSAPPPVSFFDALDLFFTITEYMVKVVRTLATYVPSDLGILYIINLIRSTLTTWFDALGVTEGSSTGTGGVEPPPVIDNPDIGPL